MDYKTCWELQQGLFDALVARKAACKGATKQVAAPLAANAGTAEASKASAREPAQRSAEAMPSKAGTQSGKGLESPTGSVSAAEGVEPSGATGEGSASAGTILLVEHPPVYTLGKSGHAENLLIGREALEAMGAQFFHIDRGGDITLRPGAAGLLSDPRPRMSGHRAEGLHRGTGRGRHPYRGGIRHHRRPHGRRLGGLDRPRNRRGNREPDNRLPRR